MTEILYTTSTAILGVFLGTQICEGALFVPYWKALAPKDFFELHKTYGSKIYKFFAPLTIAATILPLSAATYAFLYQEKGHFLMLWMGIFTLLFFSTYFIYFKKANQSFAEESLSYQELPKELDRWGKWHWGRIVLEAIAFIFALLAMLQI